jgi:Fe-S cluster assembly protein SufB
MIQINHAAVVELIALENATIYSTVQNWYSGNEFGKGGVYNFVTKRGCVQDQIPKYHGLKLKRGYYLKYPLFTCR